MKKLNKSQQKILDYLRERSQDGVPPSVREICAATGLKSTSTVHAHLKALEENGFISRDAGLNRAIHISGVERSVQVPVLGRVTAGLPILAVEDVEGFVVNRGQNYLYCGYWKVYGHVEEKKALFEKYEEARKTLVQFLTKGMNVCEMASMSWKNERLQAVCTG